MWLPGPSQALRTGGQLALFEALALLCLSILGSCGSPQGTRLQTGTTETYMGITLSEHTTFVAELDIFSGRPNPHTSLTAAEGAQLRQLLAGLAPAAAGPLPDQLGYRGFRVLVGAGEQVSFHVYGEQLTLVRGGTVSHFHDAGRSVERWLYGSSRARLPADVQQLVEAELALGP